MTDFIGKHIQYHKDGPGSKLVDGGDEVFPPHIIRPIELVSDKHYHVYVKYGYAKAFLSDSPDLEIWKNIYETMQKDKGRIPNVEGFNELIKSMQEKGFVAEYTIPVDENYDILDGSHRLATALALDIPVYVRMCSKSSKRYEKDRLISCTQKDFSLIEQERETLLNMKKASSRCSLMTVWGASLDVWNELFSQIDYKKVKRSFLRSFTQEEYLAYIATVYAGDGISHSSLTRKSWCLEKFGCKAGVLLLDYPPEELQDLKIKIREDFIAKVPQYHFDSIVHTIDNLEITPSILSLVEPYKPVGDLPIHKSVFPYLTSFLADNIHTTKEYKEVINNEVPGKLSDLVNSRIKLAIFDLDGVIADSEIISAKAYQMMLKRKGMEISLEEACKTFCGLSKKDAARVLREKYSVQFSEEDELFKKLWIRKEKQKMKKVSDIEDLIEKTGCHKCIASGSSLEGIRRSLEIIGLSDVFSDDEIFSSQELKEGKPNPELFIKIAQKYGVDPDHVMVVEDSLPGIIAANRAKMNYIWYGKASHIPYTYTKDMLIPLTKSKYFRNIEASSVYDLNMSHLLKHRSEISK